LVSYSPDVSNEDDCRYEPLQPDQEWDDELARDLVGCTLFVGITHADHEGCVLGREQVFGTVESVSPRAGIKLIQSNGQPYNLAPVLDAIEAGDVDRYQLSDEDELVENPDFVAWITATRPKTH
jgi:hypothetical protein